MAIIVALHYCCVMRIFFMPHKVHIFLHGDAGNFMQHKRRYDRRGVRMADTHIKMAGTHVLLPLFLAF